MISLPSLLYSISTLFQKEAYPTPPPPLRERAPCKHLTLLHGQQPPACLSQTLVGGTPCWMMLTVVGTARKMLSEYTQQIEVNNVAR